MTRGWGNVPAVAVCALLTVTDIHTGWTETRAVLGRGQEAIRAALEAIHQALPFPLRGHRFEQRLGVHQ